MTSNQSSEAGLALIYDLCVNTSLLTGKGK